MTPRLGYNPAIDGLRAIAVVAVIAYHLGYAWAPGGFLGVEVFLVISGFLITSLLYAEFLREGRIELRQFWIRRARRLLPALFVLVAGVTAFMALALPDELADIKGDVAASLTYVTNWYLTFSRVSYFEALGRPSPFRHLWSLAIEEQWYLLWPLVFTLALRYNARRMARVVGAMIVVALAATALMALLYEPGIDPSRIYYGTDTRSAGLLVGAVLAVTWSPWRLSSRVGPGVGPGLELAGLASLAGLIWAFARLDEFRPGLYRGGFLLVAALTAVLIATLVHPASGLLTRVLGNPVFRWIGLRSYGLYLWHWPIIVFTRPRFDVTLSGWQLDAIRLALTVVITELSFTYVETPIRHGALGRAWNRWKASEGAPRRRTAALGLAALAALALPTAVLGSALVRARPIDPAVQLAGSLGPAPAASVTSTRSGDPTDPSGTVDEAPGRTEPEPTVSSTTLPDAEPTTTPESTSTTVAVPTTLASLPRRVAVAGDSVGNMMVRNFPATVSDRLVVSDASIEGCGIIDRGRMVSGGRVRRNFSACENFPARWSASAQAAGAEVTLVVIGAWEVFDLQIDGETLEFGTPAHDAVLSEGLERATDALIAAGSEVALLEVPCFRPVDGGGLKALPERGEVWRTEHLNELLRARAATDPDNIHLVAPPEEFCTDDSIADNLNYRWDGVHYGPIGGQFVWERIADQILTIPVG